MHQFEPAGEVSRVTTPLYGGTFALEAGRQLLYVLPGELVQADPLTVLEPSVARVATACSHFGTCGGCHYQHADDATQLDLKRQILTGILTAAGLKQPPVMQIESGEPYHYRNRIRLRVEQDPGGALRVGYTRRGTHEFLPITMCPIAAPLLWRAADTLLTFAAEDGLAGRWLAITSEIELFCTPDESKLQLQFLLRSGEGGKRESSSFSGLCERLKVAVPELVGAAASLDPELNRRVRRAWAGASWGADGLNYPVAGRSYWLPRGAFFQVNRFLVERLVDLVTSGQSGDLAWDLYAGVGLFTQVLAGTFGQVVSVEGTEAAVVSLQSAARAQKGIVPIHTSTLDFLRARELQRERPVLVVIDPPRAGLGPEAAQILSRIGAPRIIYVSCDPTTLARDLAILTATYTVDSVTLIDLFPQTFHIETVTILSRKGN